MKKLQVVLIIATSLFLASCVQGTAKTAKSEPYCDHVIVSNLKMTKSYVEVSDVKLFLTGKGSYETTYLEKANKHYRFKITTSENLFPQQATRSKISAALSTFKPLAKFGKHEIANSWEPILDIDWIHSKETKILAYRKLEMVDATVDAKCSQSKFSHEIAFTYYLRNQSDGTLDCKLIDDIEDLNSKLETYCKMEL
jgi:hypothetical protein